MLIALDLASGVLHSRSSATFQENGDPGFLRDALERPAQQVGCARGHFPRCVAQQIDRVLDAPRTFERAGIDRDPQRLGQLLEVERLCRASKLDGALQQAVIHVVTDQSRTKSGERALGERGLFAAETVEDHLPTKIDHVISTASASDMPS
jgi:hypothetical protein